MVSRARVLGCFGAFSFFLLYMILVPPKDSPNDKILTQNLQLKEKILQLELKLKENVHYDQSAWKIKYGFSCKDCNGNCFLGECYCKPGYGPFDSCSIKTYVPPTCQPVTTPHGPKGADDCFYNPDYGIGEVSMDRWQSAQKAEADLWETIGGTDDRASYHELYFNNYKSLPDDMGNTLETGCGPFTQVKTIMKNGKRPSRLTLTDPGMVNYILKVENCPYKNGKLDDVKTTLINIGTEELPFIEIFDTVIMINVIEHVWNAFDVMEAVYRSLKPNGLFIFAERILWTKAPTQLYHPIRLNMNFYDKFLSKFETIHRFNGTTGQMQVYDYEISNEIYFIGRKKRI